MTSSYQTPFPKNGSCCRQVDVSVVPHKIPIQSLKYVFLLLFSSICLFKNKFTYNILSLSATHQYESAIGILYVPSLLKLSPNLPPHPTPLKVSEYWL